MAKNNIMSVWDKLISEGADATKIEASVYINECAAGILSDIMNEEEPPVIGVEDEEVIPTADQSIVTVYYADPDGTCDYDDDIISASNKDDIDGGGWGKGLRVVNFIYDNAEDAAQASSQISDIEDVPGLSTSIITPNDALAGDNIGDLPQIEDETVEVEEGEKEDESLLSPVDTDVSEAEETETSNDSDKLIVKFKSDGDETAVDEFKDFGFDIIDTHVNDEGERVIVIDSSNAVPDDLAASVKDCLRGLGIEHYTIDVEETSNETEVEEDVTTDENGVVTTDETPEETLDALQADLDALRLELKGAGVIDDSSIDVDTDGSEEISLASLEEAFLGYEEVKGKQPSELNSKTGFGSDDGKSPVLSKPIKDRKADGEPIKVKTETSSDDGTHLTASPTVKELPVTKNNIKSLKDQYKKVGTEKGAKLNSKEGFGEDGKKSIVD